MLSKVTVTVAAVLSDDSQLIELKLRACHRLMMVSSRGAISSSCTNLLWGLRVWSHLRRRTRFHGVAVHNDARKGLVRAVILSICIVTPMQHVLSVIATDRTKREGAPVVGWMSALFVRAIGIIAIFIITLLGICRNPSSIKRRRRILSVRICLILARYILLSARDYLSWTTVVWILGISRSYECSTILRRLK